MYLAGKESGQGKEAVTSGMLSGVLLECQGFGPCVFTHSYHAGAEETQWSKHLHPLV